MNCKNPFCPIEYDPTKEPCKSCKDRIGSDSVFDYLKDIAKGEK